MTVRKGYRKLSSVRPALRGQTQRWIPYMLRDLADGINQRMADGFDMDPSTLELTVKIVPDEHDDRRDVVKISATYKEETS